LAPALIAAVNHLGPVSKTGNATSKKTPASNAWQGSVPILWKKAHGAPGAPECSGAPEMSLDDLAAEIARDLLDRGTVGQRFVEVG
jgi:hypothetical protein